MLQVGQIVLGAIRSERKSKYYKVVDFASEYWSMYLILDDKNNLHPVNFCTKCYYKIDNFKRH